VQVPTAPSILHDRHLSLHAWLQQTPSAQNPDMHCASLSQTAAISFLMRQVPPSHQNPAWQSAFIAHGAPQVSSTQTAGAQLLVIAGKQVPMPSHRAAARSVAPSQPGILQTVVAG
jgi:hypothetical protein